LKQEKASPHRHGGLTSRNRAVGKSSRGKTKTHHRETSGNDRAKKVGFKMKPIPKKNSGKRGKKSTNTFQESETLNNKKKTSGTIQCTRQKHYTVGGAMTIDKGIRGRTEQEGKSTTGTTIGKAEKWIIHKGGRA